MLIYTLSKLNESQMMFLATRSRMLHRLAIPGVVWLLISILSGCATPQPEFSGFLENYNGFEPAPEDKDALVYRKPGVDLSVLGQYDRLMIDPVVIWYKDDSQYKGIHPEMLTRLADDFHQAAIEALGDRYPLVLLPGPGVLRIRTAITDLVATKPALNAATFVGPGRPVSTLSKVVTGRHLFVGEAAIEVELLDAQTDERLFAYIDRHIGNKINPVQGVTKWGHIKAAFNDWAQKLRKRLDEAHDQET
jgi:hypothetical protein